MAVRLTMRREVTSAIVSISTRLLAFSVAPLETRSTMRRQRPKRRRQFHGAGQLDAFRLHAARGEMALRDVGIFGGDADMRPAVGIVRRRQIGRFRDRQAAMADAEIDRRVDLRIVELQQHVVAGNAQLRGPEGNEGRDVETAYPDDLELRIVGAETQRPRILVGEFGLRLDAGAGFSNGQTSLRMRPLGNARTKTSLIPPLAAPAPSRS